LSSALAPEGACPVCGAAAARLLYQITRFRILACRRCEQVYLWPLPSPEEIREMFSRLYTSGDGSVPELRSYYDFCYDDAPSNPLVQLYESWLAEIERRRAPGRLLDVGCGTGLFLAVARRRGWQPFGIDDCAEATAHAREHFGLDVRGGEFAAFAAEGRLFDAITAWDVIEHARDPVGLLRSIHQCLAPGGVVGLSTPNQRSILDVVAGALYRLTGGRVRWPLEKFYIEQHFLYFTPRTLEGTLRRAGLEPRLLRRELTDLRRLSLSPPMRLLLHALFAVARASGLENRIFAIAAAEGEDWRGAAEGGREAARAASRSRAESPG
jgi:SAM-dependent methyltransferase